MTIPVIMLHGITQTGEKGKGGDREINFQKNGKTDEKGSIQIFFNIYIYKHRHQHVINRLKCVDTVDWLGWVDEF